MTAEILKLLLDYWFPVMLGLFLILYAVQAMFHTLCHFLCVAWRGWPPCPEPDPEDDEDDEDDKEEVEDEWGREILP